MGTKTPLLLLLEFFVWLHKIFSSLYSWSWFLYLATFYDNVDSLMLVPNLKRWLKIWKLFFWFVKNICYDVFVYDDYFTIWNDATFLMKIRWCYLQWYKMCFRKVKHFWRPSSCDVTVLFLNWVQSGHLDCQEHHSTQEESKSKMLHSTDFGRVQRYHRTACQSQGITRSPPAYAEFFSCCVLIPKFSISSTF